MTIYRNKKNGKLYKIYRISPPRYTGMWYEAYALFGDNRIKNAKLENFESVYTYNGVM